MKSKYKNLVIGSNYHFWTVLKNVGYNKHGKTSYKCQCECGETSTVEGRSIVLGLSRSCGCKRRVDKLEQKNRRRQYKQAYFQENKAKIYQRIKKKILENPEKDKTLRKKYFYKSKYGLSKEDFDSLLQACNGSCEICGNPFSDDTILCVDHNHGNGKVRGMLCKRCNSGLGFFNDNVDYIRNAIEYLSRTEQINEKIGKRTKD